MYLNDLEQLATIMANNQFSLLVLPRNYGTNRVYSALPLKNTFPVAPNDKGIIGIDQIRLLQSLCKSKQSARQYYVLFGAENLTEAAENAFLKLLEEPSDNTAFLLVTEDLSKLIPTVQSRAQIFHVNKLSKTDSLRMINALNDDLDNKTKQQIMFLASGLPDEIEKLSTDADYLKKQAKLVETAKKLVAGTPDDILLIAYQLKDKRDQALKVLELAITVTNNIVSSKNHKLLARLTDLETTYNQLLANANIRLAITANMIQ
ncbi:DNA polymerase III subunit [Candidatus Saccharibacteria bacterium]|nr:DNA polymerase III subunit [Candidatus Saccharibacteria bacterium]